MLSVELRNKIISLRKKGLTYSEITLSLDLNVPKSTLSSICGDIILDSTALERLKDTRKLHITENRKKALARNKIIQLERREALGIKASTTLKNVTQDTLKIALAMLYWGEGAKWRSYRGLSLGSSDAELLKTYIHLLDRCYDIKYSQIKCRIQCRADQSIKLLEEYWSEQLKVPIGHFYATYIDPRTIGKKTRKANYYGVCVVSCAGADIQIELEKIYKGLYEYLNP